ncbi:MAG TPA: monovalent cation:proton antiporter-2 (CPA2) family protein [Steroidobacteraceae bacterium]|jgi:monovalent cation:proton antiporter-2 (CPA2) family protein|nr:monovalent cation:proton antiporter-2 (CPA2) family protein [Steroidobacteraceae bacterium]
MISLAQVAILLTAAVVAVSLFRLMKQSSILGFLAAGLVIGPWGLRLITDVSSILHASEFGVVLLLFIIGLELQPTRLWVMRRTVFGLGSAQVLSCSVILGGAAWWWGLPPMPAAVVGFGLSLSSTPLVLQVLAERQQLKTQYGRAAFGILLFQDLAVLPMLAVLPLMSPLQTAHAGFPWIALVKLVGVIAIITVGARVALRPALRVVARIRVTEVFTAAALLVVIATALLVNQVGLSMALGAFLAGVVLADSEFRHELEADIEPFKGLLLGLFFIAVGMSANLGLLSAEPLQVVAATAVFLALKISVVAAVGRLTRHAALASWRMGFTLPAGGEFAFVLFALAARQRILEAQLADFLVLVVTLSMMVGPLLLGLHDRVRRTLSSAAPGAPFDTIDERDNRVIIAGFGRVGQIVSRVLRARRIKFTALDSSQTHVDFVRRFGNRIYYGDASRLDLLRAAGAESAEIFVLAIDEVDASVRTAELVRTHFPELKILARARNRQHAFALMDHGVDYIIRETYGSSLELAEAVLTSLGDAPAIARAAVRKFRQHDEKTLGEQYAIKEDEVKFMAAARESAQQLEKLFETDAAKTD